MFDKEKKHKLENRCVAASFGYVKSFFLLFICDRQTFSMGAVLQKGWDSDECMSETKHVQRVSVERQSYNSAMYSWLLDGTRLLVRAMLDRETGEGRLQLPQSDMELLIVNASHDRWFIFAVHSRGIKDIGMIRVSALNKWKMLFNVNGHRFAVTHVSVFHYLLYHQAPEQNAPHAIGSLSLKRISLYNPLFILDSPEMEAVSAIALWCQMVISNRLSSPYALR